LVVSATGAKAAYLWEVGVMGETATIETGEGLETIVDTVLGGETTQEAGVTARTNAHLWQKGQSGNPNGRPKSDKLYKMALLKRFSPEELADYWMKALVLAVKDESSKDMVRVLKEITEHLMGKPVGTTVTVKTKYEELLQLYSAAGDEPEVIDLEVE
jgi:hypothetical protein